MLRIIKSYVSSVFSKFVCVANQSTTIVLILDDALIEVYGIDGILSGACDFKFDEDICRESMKRNIDETDLWRNTPDI